MNRTRTFYYAYTTFISTELIGPVLASWTSGYSLWIPIAVGAILLVLYYPVLLIMPATQKAHAESNLSILETEPDTQSSDIEDGPQGIFRLPWWNETGRQFLSLFENGNLLLALSIFLIGVFRGVLLRVLLQYTSVRLTWKLSRETCIYVRDFFTSATNMHRRMA